MQEDTVNKMQPVEQKLKLCRATPALVGSWELRQHIPTIVTMSPSHYIVVGKEEGEVQLAEPSSDLNKQYIEVLR